MSHRLPRPQALLDAIEDQAPASFAGRLWRVVTEGRDPPLSGRAGGRWDDGTFDVLYTSSDRDGAIAEAWFHAARGQPIPPSKPAKRVYALEAELGRVLDLSLPGRLEELGINMQDYGRVSYLQREAEYPTRQQIGEVAHFYEYQAIVVPNARWPASNVVVLTENASATSISVVDEGEQVDLIAWRQLAVRR